MFLVLADQTLSISSQVEFSDHLDFMKQNANKYIS